MFYNIQPITVSVGSKSSTAVFAQFSSAYVPYSEAMAYTYQLYDADKKYLYSGQDMLGEAVVSQWGEDDQYIVNAMAVQSGLTIIW